MRLCQATSQQAEQRSDVMHDDRARLVDEKLASSVYLLAKARSDRLCDSRTLYANLFKKKKCWIVSGQPTILRVTLAEALHLRDRVEAADYI